MTERLPGEVGEKERRANGGDQIGKFRRVASAQGAVGESLDAGRAHHTASLDAPRDDDDGETGTLADSFGVMDSTLLLVDEKVTIGAAARRLSQRERRVVLLRFVEDLTQTEIAERIGVSQMQVSRILRRALARLAELPEFD